ncbi:MAG: DUF29 family protein, partial [Rhodospirillales bacterium]|nr:DUF29 family protein [Rhodospirillales bacterium]
LTSRLDEALGDAYRVAVLRAERETGLSRSTFPATSPYAYDQAIAADFWPE